MISLNSSIQLNEGGELEGGEGSTLTSITQGDEQGIRSKGRKPFGLGGVVEGI